MKMVQSLIRYVRLYGYFLSFSFSRAFEFRFDFYMRILMDLCYYAVSIAFFQILYGHTSSLGGWTEPQIMLFVSGYLIVDALNMTVFTNNMWVLPQLINRGDLDYYLVRPVSSLFFVSLRQFAANSFLNLLCALGIFAWAIQRYPEPIGIGRIVLYLALLVNGTVIFYTMNAMANIFTFWAHAPPQGFGEMVWTLNKLGERPDGIYHGFIRKLVTIVIPFAVIASFPARVIIEGPSWSILLHSLGITAVFVTMLIGFWRVGLRNYSSASS